MPHYIVPTTGSLDQLSELTQKAGLHLSSPATIRDFILEANEYPHAVFALKVEMLLILNRNASQLLDEMPSVVLAVPELVYSSEWNIAASAYHIVDFSELREKIAKTGLVSHSTDDLEKRERGTMTSQPQKSSSLREWRDRETGKTDDITSGDESLVDPESLP